MNTKIGSISGVVEYTNTTQKYIGTLPANAKVIRALLLVETAFNAGTTNTVDVGIAADDDEYLAAEDVSSAGVVASTLLQPGVVQSTTADTKIYALFAGTGTAATAGKASIVLEYVFDEE